MWLATLALAVPLFSGMPAAPSGDAPKKRIESGWRFGDEGNRSVRPGGRGRIEKILEEMLKVQKEQLRTQKRILAILEEQFDPKPRKIVVNGVECVANSSAECFEMPLTAEAKRIPVLANWLKKGDKESGREWLRWQAKYLKQVIGRADALQFALAQWGTDAYPIGYRTPGFDTLTGYGSTVVHDRSVRRLLDENAGKYEIFIFLGDNPDMDIFAYDALADMAEALPHVTFYLVFKSEGSRRVFEDAAKVLRNVRRLSERAVATVNPGAFRKFNIYTTPTVAVRLKKEKQIEPVVVGKLGKQATLSKILDFLEFRKVIDSKELAAYRRWKSDGDVGAEYYRHYYGMDVNRSRLMNNYRKESD